MYNQFRHKISSKIKERELDSSSQTPQNYIEMNEEKTIILVVEDNYDMREYIKESLRCKLSS